jgi:D-lactate dehydrogenase
MLINTCMADLILPQALIAGLKSKKIGYLGLDIFDIDALIERKLSANYSIPDMQYFHRLSSFDNVLITHHQGYFTEESISKVVETTLLNLQYFFAGKICHESFL